MLTTSNQQYPTSRPSSPTTDPIPRTVWMLSWISFFADISSEIIYPILPFLAVGAIGLSRFQLGMIEGAAVLLVAIMSAWAGIQSDRSPSRRRILWIRVGYGLPMIARVMIALATNGWMLGCGRLLDRFGKGLRGAPRDSLLADSVIPSQLGRAFGLHRAMDTAGALSGVVMAAIFMAYFEVSASRESDRIASDWGLRGIIWIGSALGMIAFIITWQIPSSTNQTVDERQSGQNDGPVAPLSRAYWKLLAVFILFSLANSSDAFLLLRVVDLGFSATGAVMLYAAYNAVYAFASYPLGNLSDRIDRRYLIGIGWGIYAFVYLVVGLISKETSAWVWPTLALYGLYMACTDGIGKAMVAEAVPKGSRGKALGLYYAATGFTQLVASALMGWLWDQNGSATPFSIAALFALVATIALFLLRPGSPHGRTAT